MSRELSVRDRAWFEAVDSEQERMARLLHDTTCQSLNAARIYARLACDTVKRVCPEASAKVVELEEVVQNAGGELQLLTRWLSPAQLGSADLVSRLADLSELAALSLPCEFERNEAAIEADDERQAGLLRIAQLALHACIRLRTAKTLKLTLTHEERDLVLEVRVSAERPLPVDMQESLDARARLLGGQLAVQYAADQGSTVTCRLPKRAEPG